MTKLKIIISLFLCCCLLTGCLNYTGIDKLTMVAGFTIDKEDDEYVLNFEIFDAEKSVTEENIKTKVIECKGKTIIEGISNCKKILRAKLYFSNTQVIIISKKIAKAGIRDIVLLILNEHDFRETIKMIVSSEKNAKDILMTDNVNSPIVSYEINDVIYDNESIGLSTQLVPVYKVFPQVITKKRTYILPGLNVKKNNNKEEYAGSDGLYLFQGQKLVGHIDESHSKAYLLVTNKAKAGDITIEISDNKMVSLQVLNSKTFSKYKIKNNQLQVKQEINMEVLIKEYSSKDREKNEEEFKKIEKEITKKIEKDIKNYVKDLLEEYKIDVFSFKDDIYRKNPKLYKLIKNKDDKFFSDIDYDVKVNCTFEDRGYLGG